MTPASDSEVETELLRFCDAVQHKMLAIEYKAYKALQERAISCTADQLAACWQRLVASGRITVFGDICRPGYCEIALT